MTEKLNSSITRIESSFKIKKYVNELQIIDSGLIHCTEDSIITIFINEFSLKFNFINDNNTKDRIRLNSALSSEKVLAIEFINFNIDTGEGALEPVSLFSINDQEIYFTFSIKGIVSNKQKEFSYTLLCKN